MNLEFEESTDSVSRLPAPGRSSSRHQVADSQAQASTDSKQDEFASNSHMLLQNSLPQIPVYNVDFETRVSRAMARLRAGCSQARRPSTMS